MPTSNRLLRFQVAISSGDKGAVREMLRSGGREIASSSIDGTSSVELACALGEEEIVQLLLKAGGSPFGLKGEAPFATAAMTLSPTLLGAFLEAGVDVNSRDEDGMTALMAASKAGRLENVNFLIDHGADVATSDKGGCTALHWALTSVDCPSVVSVLISAGVPIRARCDLGLTAADYAEEMGFLESLSVLQDH